MVLCLGHRAFLRSCYVPRLFESHFTVLKGQLYSSLQKCQSSSLLMKPQIFVEQMEACKHSTFSQAILKSLSDTGISFNQVSGIVIDSAAYCKKVVRKVLSIVLHTYIPITHTHILCVGHMNLAAEVFHQYHYFQHVRTTLIVKIKSSFYKKLGRKSRFLSFLSDTVSNGCEAAACTSLYPLELMP